MRPQHPPLFLLHDGDSFLIDLADVGTLCVRILRLIRYPDNQNASGVEEKFTDLDHLTRKAVIQQINRKHKGKTVIT